MLTRRYLVSVKNLPAIMAKVTEGTAPRKFTFAHLKSIGFKSSNDQSMLPLLKELGFLSEDGTPTQRYHDYRDQSRSEIVMARALRESYEDIFHINERPSEKDRKTIEGKFKSEHNVSDNVAKRQTATFLALLKLADLETEDSVTDSTAGTEFRNEVGPAANDESGQEPTITERAPTNLSLRYNVEVHLPATKDIEVYSLIFKSIKEHLLDD